MDFFDWLPKDTPRNGSHPDSERVPLLGLIRFEIRADRLVDGVMCFFSSAQLGPILNK